MLILSLKQGWFSWIFYKIDQITLTVYQRQCFYYGRAWERLFLRDLTVWGFEVWWGLYPIIGRKTLLKMWSAHQCRLDSVGRTGQRAASGLFTLLDCDSLCISACDFMEFQTVVWLVQSCSELILSLLLNVIEDVCALLSYHPFLP